MLPQAAVRVAARAPAAAPRRGARPPARGRTLRARATIDGQYNPIVPNLPYINAVIDAFPEAAVATPDEARVRALCALSTRARPCAAQRAPPPV